ncbi:iris-like [Brevipalpus obovatus]|uniref:iris-like n=1 Tax=Brevipalpus obovatus TaxID=246614 RepID=UPI003D9EA23F
MFIFMPTMIGGLGDLVMNLTAQKIDTYLSDLRWTDLREVQIPKFQIENTHDLKTILPTMGLDLPFSCSAHLGGISDEQIKVSESIQKTVIIVDEEGSQAAAATSMSMCLCSMPFVPKEDFILDRPFLFLLRNNDPWVNLFAGVVKKLPNIGSQQ